MLKLFRSLLGLITGQDENELLFVIEYLKEENRILREKLPKRVEVTPHERLRLVTLGAKIGSALKDLISIVTYRTFRRWLAKDRTESTEKVTSPKRGRPRTDGEIRELVVKLGSENAWGYTRIQGELKKLGVAVSRNTVKNILKSNGIDPEPKRGKGSWSEFLERHAKTIWATDFFSTKVLSWCGFVKVFVLFVINIHTRRVHLAGITAHPDKQWMIQQARNVGMFFDEQEDKPRFLIRDLDAKYVKEFDSILEGEAVEITRVGPRAPNLNAYAERVVQTLRRECLDHFIFFGEKHLRHVLSEYLDFYHTQRPHQSKDNNPLTGEVPTRHDTIRIDEVECEERLGGLLKSYKRAARVKLLPGLPQILLVIHREGPCSASNRPLGLPSGRLDW